MWLFVCFGFLRVLGFWGGLGFFFVVLLFCNATIQYYATAFAIAGDQFTPNI